MNRDIIEDIVLSILILFMVIFTIPGRILARILNVDKSDINQLIIGFISWTIFFAIVTMWILIV